MPLRAKKPEAIEKRLKALFYGPPGVGKTTAAIQFPRPYLIDTERGAENPQYVKMLSDSGGAYMFTTSPDELIQEVTALLSEKHDFLTLIIDPLTIIYNNLLDTAAAAVGTDFGKHKGPANMVIKRMLNLLLRLDMNVIITSHAKPKWERAKDAKGKDTVVDVGSTFDCYDKLDYLFDLVFEVQKRGENRVAVVRKSRVESFTEGTAIPFSYPEIAKLYGKGIIERQAAPQALATAVQISELKRLVDLLKVPVETTNKWLEKAQAETWSEMPADAMAKCITHLNSQISGKNGDK